ncbi:HAMP domain-containing histidine kinase [Microbacterium esteraromaticum]|uniref:histidine kinase n=1 Tax=Microbacterium esteraromaticum TaxID=57043 RepID=A0A939DT02_9MICO|nr:HAMP domain-containing sensor histidine kinase [Microbacterium esteraromaticum]MBN8204447.1 HAMP domain-containing histidine kinase [Microbacterium esteraromaticum]MBN8414601.1 HAMP domain-containing histidine kinase [Microbacterium esteraromaticum]
MSRRADHAVAADRARVQRSAVRSGLWVGLASAAVVTAVTATIIATLVTASRPDGRPRRDDDPGGGRPRILDLDDVLPVVIVMGVIGVLLLAVIAWYASRRASEPLAEALGVQRAFVADASHELRTPLTTLNSRIQLAEHRLRGGEDVRPVLHDMRRDAEVMDAVLTDLLLAAETAGVRSDDADAAAPVADALADAAAVLEPRAAERDVRIVSDVPPGLHVAAEPTALLRAVIALLDNAVRHSRDGGAVQLSARAEGRHVQIRVADEGTGLSGIDPSRVFERFTRSNTSAQRTGFGLGLALVRDVANRFGGSIEVEDTSPQGTTFLLTLPRR